MLSCGRSGDRFKGSPIVKIRAEGLAPGEYTVTEISDDVAARYEIQEGQTVTVSAGGFAEVKFHNELPRGQIVELELLPGYVPLGLCFGASMSPPKFQRQYAITELHEPSPEV